jgi:hypothetical protein
MMLYRAYFYESTAYHEPISGSEAGDASIRKTGYLGIMGIRGNPAMATNPNDIRLNEEERQRLARAADRNGKPWREAFREAMAKYEQGTVPDDEVDIDEEILVLFGVDPKDLKPVSPERMREILSQCSGSLAADIIADREDRL